MCHSPGKVLNICKEARRCEHVRRGSAASASRSPWNPAQQRPELTRSTMYSGVGLLGKKRVKQIEKKLACLCWGNRSGEGSIPKDTE